MWVATTTGFFSAVAHRDLADTILVRARSRTDLERLRRANPILKGRPIDRTFQADYPYRMTVTSGEWAAVMAAEAAGVDYDNFKNAVMRRQGVARSDTYHRVWAVLHAIEYELDAQVRKVKPKGKPRGKGKSRTAGESRYGDAWDRVLLDEIPADLQEIKRRQDRDDFDDWMRRDLASPKGDLWSDLRSMGRA